MIKKLSAAHQGGRDGGIDAVVYHLLELCCLILVHRGLGRRGQQQQQSMDVSGLVHPFLDKQTTW
jgi:hypothetical protein